MDKRIKGGKNTGVVSCCFAVIPYPLSLIHFAICFLPLHFHLPSNFLDKLLPSS
jgi:hypothetical protein